MTSKTDAMLERLDSILQQLESLGIKTTLPAAPDLLLDSYGNPNHVTAGTLIESAWGNSVADRTVNRFPTQASLSAWTTAGNGTLAVTTDTLVLWIRDSGEWQPTGIGGSHLAFRLVGGAPGQQIPANAATAATWATEVVDTGGMVSGGTFTVPGGWEGRWQFEWATDFAGGAQGLRQTFLSAPGGIRYGTDTREAGTSSIVGMNGAASVMLAAGNTVSVALYQTNNASGLNVNTSANAYFQGYFIGSY